MGTRELRKVTPSRYAQLVAEEAAERRGSPGDRHDEGPSGTT